MLKSWKRLAALLLCALLCVSATAGAEKKQGGKSEKGTVQDSAQAARSEEEPLTYYDLNTGFLKRALYMFASACLASTSQYGT